ncbi:MAG: hypothetical protein MZV65_17825 [Chromatiales bacterium]|nr:hypothetical protein [Chromatiales bacterium]
MGIYGMLRFVLPLTPRRGARLAGLCRRRFAARRACSMPRSWHFLQTNLRRLLAFAVVSHTEPDRDRPVHACMPIGLPGRRAADGQLRPRGDGDAVHGRLRLPPHRHRDARPGSAGCSTASPSSRTRLPRRRRWRSSACRARRASTPPTWCSKPRIERFGALPTIAAALGNVAAAGFLLWAFQRAFLAPGPMAARRRRAHPADASISSAALTLAVLLGGGLLSRAVAAADRGPAERAARRRFRGTGVARSCHRPSLLTLLLLSRLRGALLIWLCAASEAGARRRGWRWRPRP